MDFASLLDSSQRIKKDRFLRNLAVPVESVCAQLYELPIDFDEYVKSLRNGSLKDLTREEYFQRIVRVYSSPLEPLIPVMLNGAGVSGRIYIDNREPSNGDASEHFEAGSVLDLHISMCWLLDNNEPGHPHRAIQLIYCTLSKSDMECAAVMLASMPAKPIERSAVAQLPGLRLFGGAA